MEKIALALLLIFVTFVISPTVVTLANNDADVSLAFTANEEENSSKNEVSFEFHIQHSHNQLLNLHFLQEQNSLAEYFKKGYSPVALDVLSPPPKAA